MVDCQITRHKLSFIQTGQTVYEKLSNWEYVTELILIGVC
jgi:hypothetical protein